MKNKEILSIAALAALGLCLLLGLSRMAMKKDSNKEMVDRFSSLFVFIAIVLLSVSQLLNEKQHYVQETEEPTSWKADSYNYDKDTKVCSVTYLCDNAKSWAPDETPQGDGCCSNAGSCCAAASLGFQYPCSSNNSTPARAKAEEKNNSEDCTAADGVWYTKCPGDSSEDDGLSVGGRLRVPSIAAWRAGSSKFPRARTPTGPPYDPVPTPPTAPPPYKTWFDGHLYQKVDYNLTKSNSWTEANCKEGNESCCKTIKDRKL